MLKLKTTIAAFSLLPLFASSQIDGDTDSTFVEEVDTNVVIERTRAYNGTRIINGHSVETLSKGTLEFRVEHRFGDMGGTDGGVQAMFGFDNSSDIRLAFEYGITDRLMIGIGRSKGTGNPYRSLLDGFIKYRVLEQKVDRFPVDVALLGTTSYTYMKASEDESQISYFPEWSHRLAYSLQMNVARSFGDRFSLSLMPTLVHRNYVAADDVNTLFSLGGALRCGITSSTAVLLEYYHVFSNSSFRQDNKNSLGIAFEIITFGHNFTINLTNSKGFGETQFIPYTFEDWLKGQFRLGFCIGRKFVKG